MAGKSFKPTAVVLVTVTALLLLIPSELLGIRKELALRPKLGKRTYKRIEMMSWVVVMGEYIEQIEESGNKSECIKLLQKITDISHKLGERFENGIVNKVIPLEIEIKQNGFTEKSKVLLEELTERYKMLCKNIHTEEVEKIKKDIRRSGNKKLRFYMEGLERTRESL